MTGRTGGPYPRAVTYGALLPYRADLSVQAGGVKNTYGNRGIFWARFQPSGGRVEKWPPSSHQRTPQNPPPCLLFEVNRTAMLRRGNACF